MTERPPSVTHCRAQLQRIVESERLRQSRSLVRLLEYLGRKSLDGAAADLKEYTIGVEALDKSEGYDPQADASVRSQVRRLRAKLAQYYDEEGVEDPIHITLPRGGFELHFDQRAASVEAAPVAVVDSAAPWRRLTWMLAAAVCLLAVALLFQTAGGPVEPQMQDDAIFTADMEELWRPYLTSSRPPVICLGIPLFLHFQRPGEPGGGSIRDTRLNAWPPSFPKRVDTWKRLTGADKVEPWYKYMAVGEAMGAYLLGKNLLAGGLDVPIVRSPELTWDAISSNNVIYVGAPKVNPQLRIESFSRHFRIAENEAAILNLNPEPGEPEAFVMAGNDDERHAPALIGRYPSAGGGGYTTVIGSSTNLAVWGAVEYLTKPRYAANLVADFSERYGEVPEYFETVVITRLVDDHPVAVEHVAVRSIEPENGSM